MRILTVILVSFVTAVAASTGTAYLILRLGWFQPPETPKQPVPDLVGLAEADAKANLSTLGLSMFVAGREQTEKGQPGTVVRQSPGVGELVEPGTAVKLTFALEPPKVPDVVGKPVSAATEALKQAGYEVQVGDSVPDDKQPVGVVLSQDPAAGTAASKGAKVTLSPSAGAGAVEVPKLIGMGMQVAKAAAEKAKLKVKVQWVALAETTSYVVLRQKPKAGESVAPDSEVTIVVNRGD
jgi:beta-lactam-binding protein with PASTA domain